MSPSQELHPKYVFLVLKRIKERIILACLQRNGKLPYFLADSGNRANVMEKIAKN